MINNFSIVYYCRLDYADDIISLMFSAISFLIFVIDAGLIIA